MDCIHYWVIESPDGPTSEGLCQKCGERREFSNVDVTGVEKRATAALQKQNEISAANSEIYNPAQTDLPLEEAAA